ncbi:MAG: acyl-CoA reductase [Providencia sp.]|uniref:acyl-CoA reductase n=1 Tax=Providencia sp. TaxID=589 RepID=UPI003F9AFFDD
MMEQVVTRIANIQKCLVDCVSEQWQFSKDSATQAFCLSRLAHLSQSDSIKDKFEQELGGRNWRPPHRLLIVVSENDPLGTLEALLAAYLIGCKIRIKSRLSTQWLQVLRQRLGLSDDECQIREWDSQSQDDSQILLGVDTILLAGGETLIRHYRQVAPANIKLVELGPKISGMAIIGDVLPPIDFLLQDFCLFQQRVCSSPRFILLDKPECADELYQQLKVKLDTLSVLPDTLCLQQMVQYQNFKFTQFLNKTAFPACYSGATGWGLTYQTEFNPTQWLPVGFQLVVAPIAESLGKIKQQWAGQLQTLGYQGELRHLSLNSYSFTRYCPIGSMLLRPMNAAHDGFFMLSALVYFINQEGDGFA